MNLADITIGFQEIVTIVLSVAWFIRLEARALQTYTKVEKLEKRIEEGEKSNTILLERMASMEAKIDILLKK